MSRFKYKKRFTGGGGTDIQEVNQNALPSSSSPTLLGTNGVISPTLDVGSGTLMGQGPFANITDMWGNELVDQFSGTPYVNHLQLRENQFAPFASYTPSGQSGVTGVDVGSQTGTQGGTQIDTQTVNTTQIGNTQGNETSGWNSPMDGDPTNPMSMPYFMPDLGSRAQMMGRAIGNIRAGRETGNKKLTTTGIFGTAASALSLGMGIARETANAASEQYALARDARSYRKRLADERRQSQVTYQEEGGGVNIGNGQVIDTSSLTGEYIHPLPESMKENANVEIEKGEYALTPDVVGPMEATGEKHSKGGTLVNLPEAYIISDFRKIPEEFASQVREVYGIKATSKDSYASLCDKYKKNIGLKEAYEEQEKAIKRLEKNSEVKDTNTSELNKSILSKYINENQKKIDDLEADFRNFADVVYKRQEDDKRQEELKFFFRDGGPINNKTVRETAKMLNVDVEKAKEMLFDAYKKRIKMPGGGDTALADRRATALRNMFGRRLNFGVVDVAGLEDLLNPGTTATTDQGYQRAGDYYYGRGNETALNNLLDLHRYASSYNDNGDFLGNTEAFQRDYTSRLNDVYALANAGAFSNTDLATSFSSAYNFDENAPTGGIVVGGRPASEYNSMRLDGLPGQWTLSRGFYSLDVLEPGQLKKLNDAGIKNYVDVRNNPDKVRDILGKDSATWKAFEQMNASDDFSGMDFVLAENKSIGPIQAGLSVPPTRNARDDMGLAPQVQTLEVEEPDVQLVEPVQSVGSERENDDENRNDGRTGSRRGYWAGPIFPEILRDRQTGLNVEGLERHYAPRVDPVLRSADQYINELNRTTQAQLDALGDVPDSQRAAIMANMNAIAGTNMARYINEVDLYNAQQRNEADRFNQMAFRSTQDSNIAERQRYEESTLRAMAISDENRARYLDNLNQEAQQKFNTVTSLNTIRSIAPNMRMLPNGAIIYSDNGQPVLLPGNWSTPYLMNMANANSSTNSNG